MRANISGFSGGVNQSGLRDYNERLILSLIQRADGLSGSDIAKKAGVSPQTVSVILRKLETDQLVLRGAPTRGRVGKPSIPITLNPNGSFAIGLKIGRRSAALVMMDFVGTVRAQRQLRYPYPTPVTILEFLRTHLPTLHHDLPAAQQDRIVGIGIAAPFDIWHWAELIGAPDADFQQWRDINIQDEVAKMTDLPISMVNDATAACHAEHVYGRGGSYRNYAYFYLGAFAGGGIALNNAVFEGDQGNAGALGALRSIGADGKDHPLLESASIFLLEEAMQRGGADPAQLWTDGADWSGIDEFLLPWTRHVGQQLARAAVATCAVIDFEAIIIDGACPPHVRAQIVAHTRSELAHCDTRGVIIPHIEQGSIGTTAREKGAAAGPIFRAFFLNATAGLVTT